MKKRLAVILSIICAVCFSAFYRTAESKRIESPGEKSRVFAEIEAQSARAVAFGVSGKVSDIAPAAKQANDEKIVREFSGKESISREIPNANFDSDNALANISGLAMPAPMLSFDGISNKDNNDVYGFAAVPPDTNGDVGPNHFVQSVNILSRVFDKNGNALTPFFKLSDIFSVLGTPCSLRNDGSPTALYDALADRWILSQYCTLEPPFRQMIAVSQTGDPTGAYFVYEFVMPNVKFNDYPKLGVWTDGYHMTFNQFASTGFIGVGILTQDRQKALVGDPNAAAI